MSHERHHLTRVLVLALCAVFAAGVVPVGPPSAVASPIGDHFYVDCVHGSDLTGTGSSRYPFRSITHAMTLADSGDVITASAGTYSSENGEVFPITVKDGVRVEAQTRRTVYLDAAYANPVFQMQDAGLGTEIRGIVAVGGESPGDGGGFLITRIHDQAPEDAGWPRIIDCAAWNCRASGSGGGIAFTGFQTTPMTPLVEGCDILSCSAHYGGAIYSRYSSPTIRNCVIRGNGNAQTVDGGAILLEATQETSMIDGNDIVGNRGTDGAAINSFTDGPVQITDNTIAGNIVNLDGRGTLYLRRAGGTGTVLRNRITGNRGGRYASVDVIDGVWTMENNLVGWNVTGRNNAVAGVHVSPPGSVTSIGDTVCYNEATSTANTWDGIDAEGSYTLRNGIIWHAIGLSTASSPDIRGAYSLAYTTVRNTNVTGTSVSHAYPNIITGGPRGYDGRARYGSPALESGPATDFTGEDLRGFSRPRDGDANGVATADRGAFENRIPAERAYGVNRFAGAVSVAKATYPDFKHLTDVVLASGDDAAAADPLAAAGLCWLYDAPLLLSKATTLTPETRAAFVTMASRGYRAPVRVHVVGGTGSVPQARLDQITAVMGADGVSFDRVRATGDRYDLAASIATRMKNEGPDVDKPVALIANGADANTFFDACAMSAVARSKGYPILLVKSTSIPSATSGALSSLHLTQRYVAGGTGTVAESVRSTLGATRWSGSDRYATAAAVASAATGKGWLNFSTVGVACGTSGLYDALTGGALVGRDGGALLLTKTSEFTPITKSTLTTYHARIAECVVLGSSSAISDSVRTQIRNNVK